MDKVTEQDFVDESLEEVYDMDESELREALLSAREVQASWQLKEEIMERDMQKYRERLERRDAKIARYEECLRAIRGDNPCGQHHDSMAREALASQRALTPRQADEAVRAKP